VSQLAVATVGTASGPLLYAFTLGLVAAVNPCGFPLLGAYLSFFVGDGELDRSRRNLRAMAAGASVTAGFVVVFGVLGVLVHVGIDVVLGWVPWAMVPIALAMAAIGVAALAGRPIRLARPVPRLGTGRGVLAMAGFGVAYAVASLTCALPLFLAAVAGSFGRLGVLDGVGTVVAYALGMGLLLTVAGLVVANAGVAPLRQVRAVTRIVPRVAGGLLAVVGAYLAFYWIAYLVDPTASPEPIGAVEHLQTLLTAWLSDSPRVIGIVLAIAVGAAVALTAVARSGRPGHRAPASPGTEPGSVGAGG
jgi:cytochrome c-type biogenesis protein